ncbi:Ethionine resistance-conferring protein 1 [Wickerhamiella sorbophila]|uniref:Ethionine resistance-conferring protein 1 n=1 Tax=Wickerhamiella sorbophila TaxID=45607 RepID=A0A2T0FGD8_9ASCO|nr:Ethionine resistance-conferring protein 1 [Wickerhamiella sorbophila]PRT54044.1 Ethionine resistance-conferring protein 1 [Wickerhamiella sorbophila]
MSDNPDPANSERQEDLQHSASRPIQPRRRSLVINTHAGSVVGSLGRQGFADTFGLQATPLKIVVNIDGPGERCAVEDGDGGIIDTALGSSAERVLQEREDLLRDNGVNMSYGTSSLHTEAAAIESAWEQAVAQGKISTKVRREFYVLVKNAAPLAITFFLQYSLTVASIFSVGHLGKDELGAVSLAAMTGSITGFAMIQGIATCLDTLCPQSYGAGRFDLVGVYTQKCVAMTLICLLPVFIVWFKADVVLSFILPEGEEYLISLAARYLRILTIGMPPYVVFECGKRFLQAQGIFHASTVVIVICAPCNVFLNYFLVWNPTWGIGYVGAPLAVAITNWLMMILMILYVVFIDGKKCWNGFERSIFSDWGPIFRLAIPGVVMLEAEFMAFEILTLASSHLGTVNLAAQTILSTITTLAYEVPFALAVATSTRIANFIGARLIKPAILTAKVAVVMAGGLATFDALMLYTFRYPISGLFSNDQEVVEAAATAFASCSFMLVLDGLYGVLGGILRGQGRQYIGGYVNLFAYYGVGVPMALLLAFKFEYGLSGLWVGISTGVSSAVLILAYNIRYTNWHSVVKQAEEATS